MEIVQLFYKPQRGRSVEKTSSLNLIKGYGIEDDIHARWGNPRQLLIVSQSTITSCQLQPGDLWENILVNEDIESYQSGQVLQIGKDVLIRLMFHCEPCQNLDKIQLGLKKKIQIRRGFLGIVIKGGKIHERDQISLTPYRFPFLDDKVKQRFQEFVARIPPGKLVNTTDLLFALGVSKAYYRSIPILIKKADNSLPTYQIVKKDGSLFNQYIPEQKELLQSQGILVRDDQVTYSDYAWSQKEYHQIHIEK